MLRRLTALVMSVNVLNSRECMLFFLGIVISVYGAGRGTVMAAAEDDSGSEASTAVQGALEEDEIDEVRRGRAWCGEWRC